MSMRIPPTMHCGSSLEGAIRFLGWVKSLATEPTPRQISEFLGCSRATAWRYLRALKAAEGRF